MLHLLIVLFFLMTTSINAFTASCEDGVYSFIIKTGHGQLIVHDNRAIEKYKFYKKSDNFYYYVPYGDIPDKDNKYEEYLYTTPIVNGEFKFTHIIYSQELYRYGSCTLKD